MFKLPEAPDRKSGDACTEKELSRRKKEDRALSEVICEVTTPKSFLLLMEGAMLPSRDDTLANLSSSSSYFFFINDPD